MQSLLYIPAAIDDGTSFVPRCAPIPYDGARPKTVWSLYMETDPEKTPELPYHPKHNVNAFIEDYIHDWNITSGMFRYYSRVTEGGCWVLFEF
jgi:hypothetical protein